MLTNFISNSELSIQESDLALPTLLSGTNEPHVLELFRDIFNMPFHILF